MCNQYVISDNQYFSIGVASLVPGQTCVSLVPEDITTGLKKLISGVVLIYIKDRNKFHDVCRCLFSSVCELIFFFDTPPGLEMNGFVSSRFLNARISVAVFRSKIPERLICNNDSLLNRISPARRQRLFAAAQGLEYFNFWVSERTVTPKGQHNYSRSLLQVLGIYNVSLHNLLLAEEIAQACVTVLKIQERQRRAHQKSESSDCPAGVNYKVKVPGQMNL